eukprot:907289_1
MITVFGKMSTQGIFVILARMFYYSNSTVVVDPTERLLSITARPSFVPSLTIRGTTAIMDNYDNMRAIQTISRKEELVALGVTPPGHQALLLAEMNKTIQRIESGQRWKGEVVATEQVSAPPEGDVYVPAFCQKKSDLDAEALFGAGFELETDFATTNSKMQGSTLRTTKTPQTSGITITVYSSEATCVHVNDNKLTEERG